MGFDLTSNAIDFGYGKLSRGLSGPAQTIADLAFRVVKGVGTGGGDFDAVNPPGARDLLAAAHSRRDPLLNINWYLDLPIIDGKKLPWENVEEATLPYMQVEQSSVYRAGKMYHYAGHYSLGTLTLKLYEDTSGIANDYLDAWRQKVIDFRTGIYGYPVDYKFPITVTVMDCTHRTVFFLQYVGCFPMQTDPLSLGSTLERVVPGTEMSVDDVVVKIGKFEASAVPSIIHNIGKDFPANLGRLPFNLPSVFTDFADINLPNVFA